MRKNFKAAQDYCLKNKYRFTEPRQQVLQVIIKQKAPVSAYDILKILSEKKDTKPPTIYRAIEFWTTHGFIHRVESLNAYIICNLSHKHEGSQIIICDKCGITKEICLNDYKVSHHIKNIVDFKVLNWSIEIHGLCEKCA